MKEKEKEKENNQTIKSSEKFEAGKDKKQKRCKFKRNKKRMKPRSDGKAQEGKISQYL